jgi:hypothetical protein
MLSAALVPPGNTFSKFLTSTKLSMTIPFELSL